MSFQLMYETICDVCDTVMGVGEWAEYTSGTPKGIRHPSGCPKQPTTCPDCFLQHAGECG